MRRSLAAAGLAVAASLALAADAGAAPPRGEWHDPAEARLEDPGPYLFRGTASDPDGVGIDRVEFIIGGDEDDSRCRPLIDPGQPNPRAYPGNEGGGSVEFQWVASFPCNGVYQAVARVTTQPAPLQAPETADIVREHQVAAPPAKVSGLEARYVEGADDPVAGSDEPAIEVSWSPNPEADLMEYEVARAVPGGSFEPWAIVPADQTTVYDADLDGGGEYRYAVLAVRGRPGSGVEPVASEPASDAARVPGPPASTTTTDGTDAGGSGGDAVAPPATVDRAGFDDLRRSPRPSAGAGRRTVTTVDRGFGETLPFQSPGEPGPEDDVAAPPPGDGAVVAELTDTEADQRALLLPMAGALALLVGFLQVRYLLRRAGAV